MCSEGVSEQVDLKRASASERFFLALLLERKEQDARVFAIVRVSSGVVACFFARKRFLENCATTFSANMAGICTHIAGQVTCIGGTRCAT